MSKPQIDGYKGMMNVYVLLKQHGFKVSLAGYYAPFDILVDEKLRFEVKTCPGVHKNGKPSWSFNIHRHGKISEETDYYVLRLENVPFAKRKAIHLLLKAPLETPTITMEPMTLMTRYAKYADAFQDFCKQHKVTA